MNDSVLPHLNAALNAASGLLLLAGLYFIWRGRIARWTFPLWLYVSVTGVIVYLMIYQLYPSR